MAGKRKAEGIALLAAYGGDDDDAPSPPSADEDEEEDDGTPTKPEEENPQTLQRQDIGPAVAAAAATFTPPAAPTRASSARIVALGIVDYAHDEVLALSPDNEDGEVLGLGAALADDGSSPADKRFSNESPSGIHATIPRNALTPQSENGTTLLTVLSAERANVQDERSEDMEGVQVPESEATEPDGLKSFLPPAPAMKYSGELQGKFARYLVLKKAGKSLNEDIRKTKGYRNPDFLQSAVRRYEIDHIGSCFKKEIFDPHGYEPSDYYDSIALEIRREAERKEQERRQTQRVDFVRSTIQTTVTVEKPIVPTVHKVTTVSSSETSTKTDGRSSKKSKWDKVEVEGVRSQAISNAADAIAAASAHAALLTASSNAGAGYASFAQQRRREAEEKLKASEKYSSASGSKLERKTDRVQ